MFSSYKVIIAAVAVLALSGLGYLYTKSLEKIGALEVTLKAKEAETEKLRQNIKNMADAQKSVEAQMGNIARSTREYSAEIATSKNRESVVVAKPGLVEIKINKSFILREEKWGCLTGAEEYCNEKN